MDPQLLRAVDAFICAYKDRWWKESGFRPGAPMVAEVMLLSDALVEAEARALGLEDDDA